MLIYTKNGNIFSNQRIEIFSILRIEMYSMENHNKSLTIKLDTLSENHPEGTTFP